jgi:endonuclease III
VDVSANTPAPLYQWLLVSLLFSARISAGQAQKAAEALFEQGWRTADRMADTTWNQRVEVLNRAGYTRYDESTARYIGDSTDLLIDDYGGDLRRLREAAGGDVERLRDLLKRFKGIGEVGADIFCREAQLAWDELYPFADRKALEVAGRLGLGDSAADLAQLVDRRDLPRLLSGLVRVGLDNAVDEVLQTAA